MGGLDGNEGDFDHLLTWNPEQLSGKREEKVEGFGDTVQWLITEDQVWRIKTFAIDQDVHTYIIAEKTDPSFDYASLAHGNTENHYGDVIEETLTIKSDDGTEGLKAALIENGLQPHLNIGSSGVIFWSPEGTHYSTKSSP